MRHLRKSYLSSTPKASWPVFPRGKRPRCGKRVDLETTEPWFEVWFYCGRERGHAGACEWPGTYRHSITLTRQGGTA